MTRPCASQDKNLPDGERKLTVVDPATRVTTHTWATSVGTRDVKGIADVLLEEEDDDGGSGTAGREMRSRVDS